MTTMTMMTNTVVVTPDPDTVVVAEVVPAVAVMVPDVVDMVVDTAVGMAAVDTAVGMAAAAMVVDTAVGMAAAAMVAVMAADLVHIHLIPLQNGRKG